MEYAGSDATVVFMDKGHSKDAYMLLSDYYLGNVIKVNIFIGNFKYMYIKKKKLQVVRVTVEMFSA